MVEKSTNYKTVALLLGAFGVIFYSTKAVFVKMAYQYGIDPITLMSYRLLFSMPFYVVIFLVSNYRKKEKKTGKSPIKPKEIALIIFLGFIGYYISSLLDFVGLQYIDASLERLILFVYPTIVVILSKIFLKKPVTKQQLLAIALTYLGVFVIFSQSLFGDATFQSPNLGFGVGLIFLCAFTYATYLVGSHRLLPRFGTINFTTIVMTISFVSVAIHYHFSFGFNYETYHPNVYYLSFAMAIVSTLLPSYMIAEAIKRIGANTVGILGSLGPVSTISLSMLFLGERLTLVQYIGAFIILGGIFIVSQKKKTE